MISNILDKITFLIEKKIGEFGHYSKIVQKVSCLPKWERLDRNLFGLKPVIVLK